MFVDFQCDNLIIMDEKQKKKKELKGRIVMEDDNGLNRFETLTQPQNNNTNV